MNYKTQSLAYTKINRITDLKDQLKKELTVEFFMNSSLPGSVEASKVYKIFDSMHSMDTVGELEEALIKVRTINMNSKNNLNQSSRKSA